MQLTRRVFSALALTAALALSACGGETDPAGEGQSAYERGSDRGLGSASALLTMTEYASVACGHCATFHEEVWPMLHDDYIETGKVRFVFREMITGSPQFAIAGFALAHCVAPERYFDMLDLLFQQQRAIFEAAGQPGGARGQYLAIARSMGMSEADFTACLDNQEVNAEIVAAHERALADGIDSTPRFLFNGELLEPRRAPGATEYTFFLGNSQIMIDGEPVPGIVDRETFRRVIDHLLAQLEADAGGETEAGQE
jgi:protein-disulfide isomerase